MNIQTVVQVPLSAIGLGLVAGIIFVIVMAAVRSVR